MQKNRFGSGNRGKAFRCADCQKSGLVGEERYFDNSTFPRQPVCTDCKNNRMKIDAPLDPTSANLEAAILRAWSQIKPELKQLIQEALADVPPAYIAQPGVTITETYQTKLKDTPGNRKLAKATGLDSGDFV